MIVSRQLGREGIPERLRVLHELIGEFEPAAGVGQVSELRRLALVVGRLEKRLNSPQSISLQEITSVGNAVQNTVTAAQRAKEQLDGGSTLDLVPVNDAADNILHDLGAMPPAPVGSEAQTVLHRLDDDSSRILRDLEASLVRLTEQAASTQSGLDEKTAAFSNEAEALRQGVADALQSARTEFQQAVESNKAQLDEVLNSGRSDLAEVKKEFTDLRAAQETNFTSLLNDSSKTMSDHVDDMKTSLGARVTEAEQSASTRVGEAVANAEKKVASLEEMRLKAEKTLNAIGVTTLAGGYQSNARREMKSAALWRVVTVIFGAGAATLLIVAALMTTGSTGTWLGFTSKTGAAVALGALATYSGRLAGQHSKRASRYRNKELALSALNPYLEPLDDDKKAALIVALATEFFTGLDEDERSGNDEAWPSNSDRLQTAVEQVLSTMGISPK